MRSALNVLILLGIFLFAVGDLKAAASSQNDRDALVITFKDGHQQTFPVAEVAHVEFRTSGKTTPVALPFVSSSASAGHFLGKWEVGNGMGGTFLITLERNGQATKTLGSSHGTWKVENGEAHINWDDGWHDAIRRAGSKYEKVAYPPGKTFSDKPDNVADAKSLEPI
jgi:hypothetical protein